MKYAQTPLVRKKIDDPTSLENDGIAETSIIPNEKEDGDSNSDRDAITALSDVDQARPLTGLTSKSPIPRLSFDGRTTPKITTPQSPRRDSVYGIVTPSSTRSQYPGPTGNPFHARAPIGVQGGPELSRHSSRETLPILSSMGSIHAQDPSSASRSPEVSTRAPTRNPHSSLIPIRVLLSKPP